MKKNLILIAIIILPISNVFANFGMPTFDFSNLVSSIESIANAVKFYEKSIEQVNEYKARLEQLGKTFSEDTLKNFFSNFQKGEEGFKNILSSVENFKSSMDNEAMALEEALKIFDNNLNEYLGINTDGTITDFGKKITEYASPSGIESLIEKDLENLIDTLSNAKKKKDELIKEFKSEKEKLDSDIDKLKEEIQKAENEGKESQVALEILNIKNSELQFLREERRSIENKYNEILSEVNKTIAYYEGEIDRVKIASSHLINNLKSASLIDEETEKLLNKVNSYKPKYNFSI